ncbi:hypothetical protein M3A49_27640 [Paraburkholderia sp. CNPSo 3076]|uniref:hypothetical protein n=1 Tax=Paraburkholderia sp. CNPSo 3076 TaxID=2940936 RepID=UPI002259FCB4|nr:hypothetical protein [Paraburkholderia sp. CNPSo 3076]MCX5543215.1 hypothetical protein [Paraburkholderia sp. CNPSo 3076]
MKGIEKATRSFMSWHWLARRAAIAIACYLLALLGLLFYAYGMQQSGKFLFTCGSVGFGWAIGFLYAIRVAFSLLLRCRRMFM